MTRYESGTALAIPPRLPEPQPSTPPDPVDIALTAVGFGIECRDVVRRLDALLDGAP